MLVVVNRTVFIFGAYVVCVCVRACVGARVHACVGME